MDYFKQCDEKACPQDNWTLRVDWSTGVSFNALKMYPLRDSLLRSLKTNAPSFESLVDKYKGRWQSLFSIGYRAYTGECLGLMFNGRLLSDLYEREFGSPPRNEMDSFLYGIVLFEKALEEPKNPIGGTFQLQGGGSIWIKYAEIRRIIGKSGTGCVDVDMSDGKYYMLFGDFDDMCRRANHRPPP
jgi:hypothetical protein